MLKRKRDIQNEPFEACTYGHRAVAELLLDRGALINQAKDDEKTPLSSSCKTLFSNIRTTDSFK